MTQRIIFHPKAREALRALPDEMKDEFGQALFLLQQGFKLSVPLSRPLPQVAQGVEELRVRGREGIYRAFYYARSREGVLVFHVFMKKTERTPPLEIELGRKRLKEMGYG
jgi:phage-related protein